MIEDDFIWPTMVEAYQLYKSGKFKLPELIDNFDFKKTRETIYKDKEFHE